MNFIKFLFTGYQKLAGLLALIGMWVLFIVKGQIGTPPGWYIGINIGVPCVIALVVYFMYRNFKGKY